MSATSMRRVRPTRSCPCSRAPARCAAPCRPADHRDRQRCDDKTGAIVYDRALRPPEKQHAPWQERCAVQLATALAALEAAVPTGWFGGEQPAQADITVGCAVGYLRLRLVEAFAPGRYPALERLAAACEDLEAFRATRPAADEAMPARSV
jgi:glutathione S-transferase